MVLIFDQAGSFCLNALSHFTDRMGIQIAILTTLFAIFLRMTVYKIRRIPNVPFGLFPMMFACWIQYLIDRMPMIHSRMHLALSTTAGLIQASEDYLASFAEQSGLHGKSSAEIASFLYYLGKEEREAWNCNPQDLYTHLFRTMDKIRGMGVLPDIHESLWGTWALILPILMILFLVFAATEKKNGAWQKNKLYWLLPQVVFVGYAAWTSTGMFLCIFLSWILDMILLSGIQDKTEPGSVFKKTKK